MLLDSELLKWNRQGLIPAPGETEEQFSQRANYCLQLQHQLAHTPELADYGALLPDSQVILQEGCSLTAPLFDICPSWVPLFFSNQQLAPWHGGCATIFQVSDDTPTSAFLQLRTAFKNRAKVFGLYHREELIAHEFTHVGRMLFQEPHYEEILAYKTSSSAWRSWLGPIVQSAAESVWFVVILFLLAMLDIYFLVTGNSAMYSFATWFKLIPLAMIALALGRLWFRQRTCNKALQNITSAIGGCDKHARAILFRLTDREIALFATSSPQAILEYAETQRSLSLRWRVIGLAYFNEMG